MPHPLYHEETDEQRHKRDLWEAIPEVEPEEWRAGLEVVIGLIVWAFAIFGFCDAIRLIWRAL